MPNRTIEGDGTENPIAESTIINGFKLEVLDSEFTLSAVIFNINNSSPTIENNVITSGNNGFCILNNSSSPKIKNNAMIFDYAQVSDDAILCDYAQASNNARVYGNAMMFGWSRAYNYAEVFGNSKLKDNVRALLDAWVYGDVEVSGTAYITAKCTRTPLVLMGLPYTVTIMDEELSFDCQSRTTQEWMEMTNEELMVLDKSKAVRFFNKYRDHMKYLANIHQGVGNARSNN